MLKGANIEGEDEQEDKIQEMEGLFYFYHKTVFFRWLILTVL